MIDGLITLVGVLVGSGLALLASEARFRWRERRADRRLAEYDARALASARAHFKTTGDWASWRDFT